MSRTSSLGLRAAFCGLFAFALLTVRFSPNWAAYWQGLRDAKANVSDPVQLQAIDKAILGTYSARAFYVLRQSRDLGSAIEDPRHKIVRWRLLAPALGHFLHLPAWLILGLAQAGCLGLITAFAAIGLRHPRLSGRPLVGSVCLAVIAGAGAVFFTSMGLLGYYDSLLALALLAVAFVRRRWIVWLACLLGPWTDERFVIGLPLALLVRRMAAGEPRVPLWPWLKEQASVPAAMTAAYALLRLSLGGTGSSQTVGQYMHQFVFSEKVSLTARILGAGEGLRFGWFLVAAAILCAWRSRLAGGRRAALLLALGVALTALVGLFTALDLARSMVLVLPVAPLGWILASRAGWRSLRWTAPILAVAALLVPASHVVGNVFRPVDSVWIPPPAMLAAQNNLGWIFGHGEGVPKNEAEACKWFRRAAEQGNPEAQHNLGVIYASGRGVPKDAVEAVKWYRKAAEQGLAVAQYNLGVRYAQGDGVPRDGAAAVKWLERAAAQGDSAASYNLGVMYAGGVAVDEDGAAAARWYEKAVEQGNASAPNNLGVMYVTGNGVAKDVVQAARWFMIGGSMGSESARRNLTYLEDGLTPEQLAEAAKLAQRPTKSP